MGGFGSGGARVGAGRKKKDDAAKVFHGTASGKERKRAARRRRVVATPAVPMPDDLMPDERKIWKKLAPHALEAGTLTLGTAVAFRHLCEAIVLKRQMLGEIREYGLSTIDPEDGAITANPLLSQYRTMLQRVEAGMTRFMLSPTGKSVVPEEEPEDPFSAFDEDDDDAGNRTH